MSQERITVSKTLPYPAAKIFAVVANPQGHIDIDGSGMLVSAEDAAPLTQAGDTFEIAMHHDAFGDYKIQNEVTAYEPDRKVEWKPTPVGGEASGVIWGYELSPAGDSTNVTSYYDWSGASEGMRASGMLPVVSEEQIQQTMSKLEGVLQSS